MCFMEAIPAAFLTRSQEITMNARVHKTFATDAASQGGMTPLDPCGETIALDASQTAHLRDASGWTIRALDGSVWITQDGDIRDVVLEAGQTVVLDRNVPTLLSPFGKARISVRLDTCHNPAQPRRVVAPTLQSGARLSIA